MEKAIGDPSALRFSAGFYRGVAFGKSYEDCFRLGCNEIDLTSLPDSCVPQFAAWAKPKARDRRTETSDGVTVVQSPTRTWTGRLSGNVDMDRPDSPRLYPVWFATDREPKDINDLGRGFSANRDRDSSKIHLGICHVVIPKAHRFGSVGSGWWKRFVAVSDDRLRLIEICSLEQEAFWSSARRAIVERDPGERIGVIFIHGFRVTFEEAAIRAAQIGFDLKVPGITALFSWPSKGRLSRLDYAADEATIEASAGKMKNFLAMFAEQTNVERLHVIAHSMGNRALLKVMERTIAEAARVSRKPFYHIVFAAPDVDAAVFRDLASGYRAVAEHATLYVSSRDRAVASSGIIHDAPRAGFVPPVMLIAGIDTIDVSNVDLTLLGHGYYGVAEGVLYDMRELLVYDAPPSARTRLNDTGQGYWQIGK
jgi:esterase/lipase superfamily enzyme